MVRISEYTEEQYKERFVIQPPVEVGDHVIDSLGRIAAIAAKGFDAHPETIDELTAEVNHTAALLYESGGVGALSRYFTNVASRRHPHTFFPSKY